jgi:hypothetical protein
MIFLLQAAIVFVFPAGAIWALRSGGGSRLWQYAGVMLVNLALLAMALASPVFGNRLAPTYGYWPTLRETLVLEAFTEALPVVVATLIVQGTGRRLVNSRYVYSRYVYGYSAVGAILSFAIGVVAASYVLQPSR